MAVSVCLEAKTLHNSKLRNDTTSEMILHVKDTTIYFVTSKDIITMFFFAWH